MKLGFSWLVLFLLTVLMDAIMPASRLHIIGEFLHRAAHWIKQILEVWKYLDRQMKIIIWITNEKDWLDGIINQMMFIKVEINRNT